MSQPKRYFFIGDLLPGQTRYPHHHFVLYDDYASLAAENERLKASQLSLEKWIACEQAHFETADNLREKLYQASLEVERLRKLLEMYLKADPLIGEAIASAMLAAKEGDSK